MSGMVIVGGGQAGYSVSNKLRSMGFNGEIVIVCAENILPYQRPPLSKKFLMGDIPEERLFFRPADYYKKNNIIVKLGVKVTKIDRTSCKVYCSDGTILSYIKLFLVTGSEPNKFKETLGGNLAKNYYIRSAHDIRLVTPEFQFGKRVLIIGGGYIGLEIASIARKKNLDVILVESQDRILKRVACTQTATFFKQLHEKNGVKVIEGRSIRMLVGKNGVFSGAILDNEEKIEADFCIIGIGIKPNTELARESGLELENGVKVDDFCQTSDENILAAGDCTNFPYGSARLRLESVGNAIEQAEVAALTALDVKKKYEAKPWFWSDQYDVKLQIAGLSFGYDQIVERTDLLSSSTWYFQRNKLIAVDAINDAKAFMVGKKLIELGKSPEKKCIANSALDLKFLLKSS